MLHITGPCFQLLPRIVAAVQIFHAGSQGQAGGTYVMVEVNTRLGERDMGSLGSLAGFFGRPEARHPLAFCLSFPIAFSLLSPHPLNLCRGGRNL